MSEQKFKGEIIHIGEVQEGTSKQGNPWKKVVVVVKQNDAEYPQTAAFTVFGSDDVDNFLNYRKVGDTVDVSYNIESREYNDRWYTDLRAWKVWGESRATQNSAPESEEFEEPDEFYEDEEDDDLPF